MPAEAIHGSCCKRRAVSQHGLAEIPLAGEPALFEDFADDIVAYQKKDAAENGPLRGFHAKIHAGFIAEFQVLADLPEHARHGVFAAPRTFPAVVRFSNGDSRINPDRKREPRGIAIKLIGVEGRKLLPGQGRRRDPGFPGHQPFRHLDGSRRQRSSSLSSRRSVMAPPHGRFPSCCRAVGSAGGGAHLSSALPHRPAQQGAQHGHGKFLRHGTDQIRPLCGKVHGTPGAGDRSNDDRRLTNDFLREELADRLRKADLVFDFLIQFYVDDMRTPIEDTSVPWRPEDTPLLKVAQLRIRAAISMTRTPAS